jgi:hypothetical protein
LIDAGIHAPSAIFRAYALPLGTPRTVPIFARRLQHCAQETGAARRDKKIEAEVNPLSAAEMKAIVKKLFQPTPSPKSVAKIGDVLVPKN